MTDVNEDLKQRHQQAREALNRQRAVVGAANEDLAKHDEAWRSYEARGAELPSQFVEARRAAYRTCEQAKGALPKLEREVNEAARALSEAERVDREQAERAKGAAEYLHELTQAQAELQRNQNQTAKLDGKCKRAANRLASARLSVATVTACLEEIEAVQAQRTTLLAEAYLQAEAADTRVLDERVADLELRLHAARIEAEGAEAALPALQLQVEQAREALAGQQRHQRAVEGDCQAAEAALIEHRICEQIEQLGASVQALQAVAANRAATLKDCWKKHGLFVPRPSKLELPNWLATP